MSPAVTSTCAQIEYRHPRSPAVSCCAQIEYRHPGHLPGTATDADQLPMVGTPGRGPGVGDSARHLPVQANRADSRGRRRHGPTRFSTGPVITLLRIRGIWSHLQADLRTAGATATNAPAAPSTPKEES
jgi:hypothetical protein